MWNHRYLCLLSGTSCDVLEGVASPHNEIVGHLSGEVPSSFLEAFFTTSSSHNIPWNDFTYLQVHLGDLEYHYLSFVTKNLPIPRQVFGVCGHSHAILAAWILRRESHSLPAWWGRRQPMTTSTIRSHMRTWWREDALSSLGRTVESELVTDLWCTRSRGALHDCALAGAFSISRSVVSWYLWFSFVSQSSFLLCPLHTSFPHRHKLYL